MGTLRRDRFCIFSALEAALAPDACDVLSSQSLDSRLLAESTAIGPAFDRTYRPSDRFGRVEELASALGIQNSPLQDLTAGGDQYS